MKWCKWCECWHSPKARHIDKYKWLIPAIGSLYETKSKALKMGYGKSLSYKPIKVLIQMPR